jgi:hypothetical protein
MVFDGYYAIYDYRPMRHRNHGNLLNSFGRHYPEFSWRDSRMSPLLRLSQICESSFPCCINNLAQSQNGVFLSYQ